MSDREKSIRPLDSSAPEVADPPPPRPDAEYDRPFREPFARRLPADVRAELTERARAAYSAALEADGAPDAFPDESDTMGRLRAAAVDLRETVALLESISEEHLYSDLGERDTVLCILAGVRRLEVEAVTERVEAVIAFEPTRDRPLPAELCAAAIAPEAP